MSTGDVLTKHTIDATAVKSFVDVKFAVLSKNGTNDTYITKVCLEGLLDLEGIDVDNLDFLIHVPLMLMLILAGVFGNTLITWVLWRQQRRTLTGGLLVMVALTDSFVLLFYFLHFTLPTMYEYGKAFENYYIFYASDKIYIWFGYCASRTMSIYAVVLVVANRYLSVACEHKIAYMRKIKYAKLGVALVIAGSILLNAPQILLFESTPYYDPCGDVWMPKIVKSGILHRASYIVGYQLLLHLFVLYIIPTLILIFCLLKLLPYTKRKMSKPPTNAEETLDNKQNHVDAENGSDETSVAGDVKPVGAEFKTGNRNDTELEMIEIGLNPEDGETSEMNSQRRRSLFNSDFSDGDVESPALVNERIVAVIYTFLLLHTLAIVLHIIITGMRLSGERLGTGNVTSMVLSEFHELILGSFCAIKFYLYIFIGRRYWHALEKTMKLCTDSKCTCKKTSKPEISRTSRENHSQKRPLKTPPNARDAVRV